MGGFILRSTAKDQLLWEQRINERTKSGMSVSKWCKDNEISKGKYHYCNHKISEKQNLNKEISSGRGGLWQYVMYIQQSIIEKTVL